MIDNIKKAIKEKGMKYSFVAEKTDIPYKSFSAAMNGRRRITVEELIKISRLVETPVEKLIEGAITNDNTTHTS